MHHARLTMGSHSVRKQSQHMVLRRDATIPEPSTLYSGSRQWEGGNSNKPVGGQHTAVGAVVLLGHTGYGRGRLGWRAPAAHSTQRVCGGAAGTLCAFSNGLGQCGTPLGHWAGGARFNHYSHLTEPGTPNVQLRHTRH